MTATSDPIKIACRDCRQKTMHDILCESQNDVDPDYHYISTYQVVQCRGCLVKGFRHYTADYEQAYPVSEDEWEVPESEDTFPRFNSDHRPSEKLYQVPDIVSSIYRESLLAVQEDALTLAGLGLRGTIEAICNERSITGGNLAVRITKLSTQGLISKKDAERLHAIRFLGNDAAHEIKKPTKIQIDVALKIIDHLINSVYLLDLEARTSLDTAISDVEQLKSLLDKKISVMNKGDEFPLAKFLGKDVRRLEGASSALEADLVTEINNGKYGTLTLGKVDKYANSPTDLQHFIVA